MDRELREAVKACTTAETLVNEARSGEPLIQPLPPLVLCVECERLSTPFLRLGQLKLTWASSSASNAEPTENESSSDPRAPDSSSRQSILSESQFYVPPSNTMTDSCPTQIKSKPTNTTSSLLKTSSPPTFVLPTRGYNN